MGAPVDGDLVHSRVVSDPGTTLETALDRSLTGYAVFVPQDALLLDAEGRGVLALLDGVPTAARHTGTGRVGSDAVADLSGRGPYRVDLYADDDPARHGSVAPDVPAAVLGADPALAERTRSVAADRGVSTADTDESPDALAAFLDDEAKIEAIRERAREEAARRAEEWGFDDLLER